MHTDNLNPPTNAGNPSSSAPAIPAVAAPVASTEPAAVQQQESVAATASSFVPDPSTNGHVVPALSAEVEGTHLDMETEPRGRLAQGQDSICYLMPDEDLPEHEDCQLIQLDETTIDQLATSIGELGQMYAGIVFEHADGRREQVAGRRRKRACRKIGIPFAYRTIKSFGDKTPVRWIVDEQMASEAGRRLTSEQRAIVGARLCKSEFAPKAELRESAGKKASEGEQGRAHELAAKAVGATPHQVRSAGKIIDDEKLWQAVYSGKCKLPVAVRIIKLSGNKRAKALAALEKSDQAALKKLLASETTPARRLAASVSMEQGTHETKASAGDAMPSINGNLESGLIASSMIDAVPIDEISADQSQPPATIKPGIPKNPAILAVSNRLRELAQEKLQYETIYGMPDFATMPFDELAHLAVAAVSTATTLLFLWAPQSIGPAVKLCEAWGFEVIESCVAIGPKFASGMFEQVHRLCLVARRGPVKLSHSRPQSLFEFNGNGHYVDTMRIHCRQVGAIPYLQLFGPMHDEPLWTVVTTHFGEGDNA